MTRAFSILAFLIGAFFLGSSADAGQVTLSQGAGTMTLPQGLGQLTFEPSAPSAAAANGVLGNTLITDSNARAANQFVYSSFTTTTAGQLTYCHARIEGISTASITIGVYAIDGSILAYWNGLAGTSIAWRGGALNTPIQIEASTNYILGVVTHDASWSMFKRSSVTNHYRRQIFMPYATTLSSKDFSTGYTDPVNNNAISIQCDNTAATP